MTREAYMYSVRDRQLMIYTPDTLLDEVLHSLEWCKLFPLVCTTTRVSTKEFIFPILI